MSIKTVSSATVARRTSPDATTTRMTSLSLFVQFAFMIAALVILGNAINWPASLDLPAAEALPLIQAQSGAVALGYTSYFISALLLIPIALLMQHLLRHTHSAVLLVGTGLGVLAGFAKLLGIGRWLLMMPGLAEIYTNPQASPATRDAVTVTFEAFNAYAGGIGEMLGVALLAGLWTLCVAVVLLRSTRFPRWLGWLGIVAAMLLLVAVIGPYGVELGPLLIIQGVVWQIWLLALGALLLRARNGTVQPDPARS